MKLKRILSSTLAACLAFSCVNFNFVTAEANSGDVEPIIQFDFENLTKNDTKQFVVKNSITDTTPDYRLFIDASSTNKSTFGAVNNYKNSDGTAKLNFESRAYMNIVTGCTSEGEVSSPAKTQERKLLDGAFTFETWVWVKDSTSMGSGGTQLLWVGDSSTYNLKVNLERDISKNKMRIYFDRTFEDGGGKKQATGYVMDYGVWNHIFISYDPSSNANLPTICLNGEYLSVSATQTNSTADKARMSDTYTGFTTQIGAGSGYTNGMFHTAWSGIKIYDQALTASDALEHYNASRESFMGAYKVKELRNNETATKVDDDLELSEGKIEFDFDFTDIKPASVNATNIKVLDSDNKDAGFDVALNGTTATISKKFVQDGTYTLKISGDMLDTTGAKYRSIGWELPFTVVINNTLRDEIVEDINELMNDTTVDDETFGAKLISDFNYILGIDVSEGSDYSKIINKSAVFAALRTGNYTSLTEIQTAFTAAVANQAAQDVLDAVTAVKTAAALADTTTMVSDLKTALFTTYATVFKLDTADYNKLGDKDKALEHMKGFAGTTVDDVKEAFAKAVKQQEMNELIAKFFDDFYACTAVTDANAVIVSYNKQLKAYTNNDNFIINTNDKYYKKYTNEILTAALASGKRDIGEFATVMYQALILNAINAVEVGNREEILNILDGYDYWNAPEGYKYLTTNEKNNLAVKMNDATQYAKIDEIAQRVSTLIAGGLNSDTSDKYPTPSNTPSASTKKDNYVVPSTPSADPIPASPIVSDMPFTDVENYSWATEGIKYLVEKKVISGKSATEFAPGDSITREEIAKIIALAFGFDTSDNNTPFADVAESDWSAAFINALYKAGIITGVDAENFGKSGVLKRCDLAVILQRLIEAQNITLTENENVEQFADYDDIPDYAKEAVSLMQKAGIMDGVGNNCFNPNGTVTRAAAVKVIYGIIMAQNGGNA